MIQLGNAVMSVSSTAKSMNPINAYRPDQGSEGVHGSQLAGPSDFTHVVHCARLEVGLSGRAMRRIIFLN